MKPFETVFLAPPPELVKPGESEKPLYQRFCTEQPNVIAFITKHGTDYSEHQVWTALTIGWACMAWQNYVGRSIRVPVIALETLTRLFAENKDFVSAEIAGVRDMNGFKDPLSTRQQSGLRLALMASVFDATQHTMIAPTDCESDPDLVADQDLAHVLIGTVIDASEDVATATT